MYIFYLRRHGVAVGGHGQEWKSEMEILWRILRIVLRHDGLEGGLLVKCCVIKVYH